MSIKDIVLAVMMGIVSIDFTIISIAFLIDVLNDRKRRSFKEGKVIEDQDVKNFIGIVNELPKVIRH